MNRSKVLAVIAILLLGAVAAFLAKPLIKSYVWKWRSEVKEVPLAGGMVSYRDFGDGRPAAVIVSGLAVQKDGYYDLQKGLASETRVIAYDRPGIGGNSTANSEPRTLDYIDKDMRALLRALNVAPPYILIGHSLGGHIIRYYADRHPDEVAGLVFLDAPHEDWFNYIRKTWSEEQIKTYFKWWTPENNSYAGTGLEELLAYEVNCDMIRSVKIPPQVPVLMFTGNNTGHFRKSAAGQDDDRRNWAEMQASLLIGVKDARHLVDWKTGHWMHRDKPEWVTSEIAAFIRTVRRDSATRPSQFSPRSPSLVPATGAASGSSP